MSIFLGASAVAVFKAWISARKASALLRRSLKSAQCSMDFCSTPVCAIEICSGNAAVSERRKKPLSNSLFFSLKVAEHASACTSCGNAARTVCSAPLLSRASCRSASSITTAAISCSLSFFNPIKSEIRAGVPMITAGFSFNLSICRFSELPPTQSSVLNHLVSTPCSCVAASLI